MLRVEHLLDDVKMASGEFNDSDTDLMIVVSDYDGKLHYLAKDNIQHDYNENLLILEMHGEIEDEVEDTD